MAKHSFSPESLRRTNRQLDRRLEKLRELAESPAPQSKSLLMYWIVKIVRYLGL